MVLVEQRDRFVGFLAKRGIMQELMERGFTLALLLTAACQPPPEIAEARIDLPNVHFYFSPEAELCSGSATFLDAVAAKQAELLGVALGEPIAYHYRPFPAPLPCPA